jgi:hypothetical protein
MKMTSFEHFKPSKALSSGDDTFLSFVFAWYTDPKSGNALSFDQSITTHRVLSLWWSILFLVITHSYILRLCYEEFVTMKNLSPGIASEQRRQGNAQGSSSVRTNSGSCMT